MIDVRLDSAGIREILINQTRSAVHDAAEQIAGTARGLKPQADEIVVDDYTTDRAASSVTIRDPRALLWHTRDGVLTRAAASVGLEVRSR